jgi:hypothetical protein
VLAIGHIVAQQQHLHSVKLGLILMIVLVERRMFRGEEFESGLGFGAVNIVIILLVS